MLIAYCNELLESGLFGFIEEDGIAEREDSQIYDFENTARNDDIYDYDEIISDAFSYSISKNKLNISFYLFKNYHSSIFGNKDVCIESLIQSLKDETKESNKILFANERLFIIQNMIRYIDHSQCYELFDTIHEIINEDPDSNFLVY